MPAIRRTLSRREKVLAVGFGALMLGIVLWFGADSISGLGVRMAERERGAKLRLAEAKAWIAQESLWKERGQWLQEKMPRVSGAREASPKFLEQIQKSAQRHKLTILQQSLDESVSEKDKGIEAVSARITVKGSMQDLSSWIGELQQPGLFVEIPTFELKPAGADEAMECAVVFRKWFATGTAATGEKSS